MYFMAIWSILRPFGVLCGHLVFFMVIWYILPRFGMLYQEKSGNPAPNCMANFIRVAKSQFFNCSLWKMA
jgi:hypothetical protein